MNNFNSTNQNQDLEKQVTDLHQKLESMENLLFAGKEVLSLEETAVFMNVTKSNLYHMTHEQTIPFYKPGGKMCYFEKSELLKWMRRNRVSSMEEIEEEANSRLQELSKK